MLDLDICHGQQSWSLAALEATLNPPPGLRHGESVALHLPDSPRTVAALAWLHQSARRGALLQPELTRTDALQAAERLGCSYLLTSSSDPAEPWCWEPVADARSAAEPGLLLETSGSTGLPKSVFHSWESLLDSVAIREELAQSRWMTLYPATRFAGLNTILHALANRALLVIPTALTPRSIGEHLVRWQPTHLSGTPTLWRTILMQVPLGGGWREQVLQITLGGETVDQSILDLLAATFPQARLTHIYASTEAGVCAAVSDGRAGFPAEWLAGDQRRVQLRVDSAGELLVRRTGPRSAPLEQAAGGWWRTGDLVRVEGDRVFFLGRDSDVLNVGGAKVSPATVEACLVAVAGVAAARVFGRKSSIAGAIVAAEVVPVPGTEPAELRRLIFEQCRARLSAYAVPRSIEFVTALPMASSGKLQRKVT